MFISVFSVVLNKKVKANLSIYYKIKPPVLTHLLSIR